MNKITPKFELGRELLTGGVSGWAGEDKTGATYTNLLVCLKRHVSGDWGEVCAEDQRENDVALKGGGRILSAYTVGGKKIWIITEWDRSMTTILFPDEY